MAVSALQSLTQCTTTLTDAKYEELIRKSEQLRILKNFTRAESTLTKNEIITLINAMEVTNE